MSTAFVTGGSGFIGGTLVRRLVAEGWTVHALARSAKAADVVRDHGAAAVPGDLGDVAAMAAGAEGCDVAFHAAAKLGEWGKPADFWRENVTGTQNVVAAARQAGVGRLVHIGTEAALMRGQPLIAVDERAPLAFDSPALYSATKARAEEAVVEASRDGLQTVVIRPRLVWGRGDTTILPGVRAAVEAGRFAWIGGGRHRTSTTHVDNVVEGLLLGASRGAPAGVYFVTDGAPVEFRAFMTRLLATAGVVAPDRSVPRPVVAALAAGGETAWRLLRLRGQPPVTRLAYWLAALEATIDITRARTELGYAPVIDIDTGMKELQT